MKTLKFTFLALTIVSVSTALAAEKNVQISDLVGKSIPFGFEQRVDLMPTPDFGESNNEFIARLNVVRSNPHEQKRQLFGESKTHLLISHSPVGPSGQCIISFKTDLGKEMATLPSAKEGGSWKLKFIGKTEVKEQSEKHRTLQGKAYEELFELESTITGTKGLLKCFDYGSTDIKVDANVNNFHLRTISPKTEEVLRKLGVQKLPAARKYPLYYPLDKQAQSPQKVPDGREVRLSQ